MARNHRSGDVSNRLETTSRGQILQRRSTVSCVPRVVAMGGVSGSLHPPVAPNHGGGGGMLGSFYQISSTVIGGTDTLSM